MSQELRFQKAATILVCAIVVTIPLIFGAVHPIVRGSYGFVMVVFLGGWLLLNVHTSQNFHLKFWFVIPLLVIGYIAFQSLPLPLDWVEYVSFARADRVRMVNELAGTNQKFISISEAGPVGFLRAILLLGCLFYYLTLKRLLRADNHFLFTLLYCLIAIGLFEAFYGLVQFVKPQLGILWLTIKGRAAHGTIIYKNQYASLLNMLWPITVAASALYFLKSDVQSDQQIDKNSFRNLANKFSSTKFQAPLLLFGTGVIILAVLFSLSRGGILGMVLILILFSLLLPFKSRTKLIFLSIFITVVCGYGTMLGLDTIISRFGTIDKSGSIRMDIYLSSLPMLFDHWLTGSGLESYVKLSSVYLKGFPANLLYDRVHNEYLELAIELGVPVAFVLFFWIFCGLATLLKKIVKEIHDKQIQIIATGAFCGLLSFILHGFIDFGWRLPSNLLYAITLLAICTSCIERSKVVSNVLQEAESIEKIDINEGRYGL